MHGATFSTHAAHCRDSGKITLDFTAVSTYNVREKTRLAGQKAVFLSEAHEKEGVPDEAAYQQGISRRV